MAFSTPTVCGLDLVLAREDRKTGHWLGFKFRVESTILVIETGNTALWAPRKECTACHLIYMQGRIQN